ncbi:serine hydrolase [Flagellimonas sp. DF-77]|uniref:serine hydrolase domain-containing protein n=1 Tax=Flagellimonas algarum TaxID=3230298 RepID=UPI003397A66C
MRILKKIFLILIGVVIGVLVLKWNTVTQSYHWLQYANYDERTFYFQNQERVFDHRVVRKSSKPFAFPKRSQHFHIPEYFVYKDSTIHTSSFIDQMGYEGLIVIKEGRVAYEAYWRGMESETTHSAMSMSKSILSMLVGFAIDDGFIHSIDDNIVTYLPELRGTALDGIKVTDCLDMLSGIAFCDFCEADATQATLTQFFWHFSFDRPLIEFVSKLQASSEPGVSWNYQTMDAIIIGLVLDRALLDKTITEYTQAKLWEPLGAEHDAQWIMGGKELELVGSNFTASLRDFAKLGQFYLQKGTWQGKQLLSKDWIMTSTIPDKEVLRSGMHSSDTLGHWGYKHFWWTPERTSGHEFMAAGRFGQILYINVDKEVVIVGLRIGPDPSEVTNESEFNLNSKVYLFQQIAESLD